LIKVGVRLGLTAALVVLHVDQLVVVYESRVGMEELFVVEDVGKVS
jgi:hypothetical protein